MVTKNTPPEYGLSPGPMIVAYRQASDAGRQPGCEFEGRRRRQVAAGSSGGALAHGPSGLLAGFTTRPCCISALAGGVERSGRPGPQTCQWNRSSPAGPALHDVGGSFCKSYRVGRPAGAVTGSCAAQ